MPAQIVFLTLFLGLTAGIQQIDLHVDGPVKSVRIVAGERELARLSGPPWSARVDLGPLMPEELAAIGLDANGNEIARATQILNLPRPMGDFEIALEDQGRTAALRWHHLMSLKATSATMSIDGRNVEVGEDFRASLPKLDPLLPHIIAAEVRFEDGFVARKELVIQGLRSDSTGTELTPVMVWERPPSAAPRRAGAPAATQNYDGCFSTPVNAVEKPEAHVIVVQDPYPGAAIRALWGVPNVAALGRLDPGTSARIMWPIGRTYGEKTGQAMLFEHSPEMEARDGGLGWLLTRTFPDRKHLRDPRRFADALAVAGLNSMTGGFRRAVVLVLNDRKDVSDFTPEMVRQYLAAIGVPLFVWSVSGPRPDLAKTWGPVDDISNPSLLSAAVKRLKAVLDQERIAWVAADPLTALHVEVKSECGLQRVP